MINNDQKFDEKNFSIYPLYTENRKDIIQIMQMINAALDNSSQTFFLGLYYMDLICTNKNFEKILKSFYEDKEDDLKIEINNNDLVMISLACLIIATKYNENDPHVPNIISFINLCSYYSYNKYNYQVSDLSKAEVIVIKFLEYKLNFFTLYHFFTFFFTHGFLFEKIFENEKIKEKKYEKNEVLEKIYIQSREIMDKFIGDNENIIYILGKNIYFTAIQILIWSIEHILNIPLVELINEEKNIFELLYNINYDENKENNEIIKNKIQNIYDNIIKKDIDKEKNNTSNVNPNNNETLAQTQISSDNKENYLSNETYTKMNNDNINNKNNNMSISSDNFYLEKFKNKYNYFKISKNDYKNKNINLNANTNKMTKYMPKYRYISKIKKIKSKSTDNYKYKQLFQFGNNINKSQINSFNYSSDKKKIIEKKREEEEEEKDTNLKNSEENFAKKILKNINNISICTNINKNNDNNMSDSLNKYKNNSICLNYRYDSRNNNNDVHKSNISNDFKNNKRDNLNNNKGYITQKYNNNMKLYNDQNLNENNREMVNKTKAILDKLNFTYTGNPNTIDFNIINGEKYVPNKPLNFYYNKLYDNNNLTFKNKKSYLLNDRYNIKDMKENIQDNTNNNSNKFNSTNISSHSKNKNINYFKTKKYGNDSLYSYNMNNNNNELIYRKEEKKLNNNLSRYGTYYQYGKLNKYENIDKFCNIFQKKEYIPFNFRSCNKYY